MEAVSMERKQRTCEEQVAHLEAENQRLMQQAGALWECLVDELDLNPYVIERLIENHGEEWVKKVFKEDYEIYKEAMMDYEENWVESEEEQEE